MKKITLFVFLALVTPPAQAEMPAPPGQVIDLPCTTGYDNPDTFKSLIDNRHFISYGGRSGTYLDPQYSKFIKFEKKFSYQGSGYRYPQEYGICKLMIR